MSSDLHGNMYSEVIGHIQTVKLLNCLKICRSLDVPKDAAVKAKWAPIILGCNSKGYRLQCCVSV